LTGRLLLLWRSSKRSSTCPPRDPSPPKRPGTSCPST